MDEDGRERPGRKMRSGADYIMSSSMALTRSHTFDSSGREMIDTAQVHRRGSQRYAKKDITEHMGRRISLRGGVELRLPSFDSLGISARFSKGSPFLSKASFKSHNERQLSPPRSHVSPEVTNLPASQSDTNLASHTHLHPTFGLALPLTPPEERASLDYHLQRQEMALTTPELAHTVAMEAMQDSITSATSPSETVPSHAAGGLMSSSESMSTPVSSSSPTPTQGSQLFWLNEGIDALG